MPCWGAQTQRAVENFPISGRPIERALIGALGHDQGCRRDRERRAACHPEGHGERHPRRRRRGGEGCTRRPLPDRRVPDRIGHLVEHEHERGDRHARRPSDSGGRCTRTTTSTRRSRRTTCSRRRSTSRRRASSSRDLLPALEHLAKELRRQQRRFKTVVKAGRTHLMDATPVTLGQEFGGYAAGHRERHRAGRLGAAARGRAAARRHRGRHRHQLRRVGSRRRAIAKIATDMQLPLTEAPRSLRGPGRARCARRGVGRLSRDRGLAQEDRR